MNINYFVDSAENSFQKEFNDDWEDVIQEKGDDFTMLITEDNFTLTVLWTTEGKYNGHHSFFLGYDDD